MGYMPLVRRTALCESVGCVEMCAQLSSSVTSMHGCSTVHDFFSKTICSPEASLCARKSVKFVLTLR